MGLCLLHSGGECASRLYATRGQSPRPRCSSRQAGSHGSPGGSPFALGSRGRQSTTGANSAEWFGYGGAGDWKEFAVQPNQPLLLSTRGDGQLVDDIRFTISENEGGTWVVKETIQGPTGFSGYRWYFHTPAGDRVRITAQGWF